MAAPKILFLDDRRSRWDQFSQAFPQARWVKTAAQVLAVLREGWDVIYLDHDLNDEIDPSVKDRLLNNGVEACRHVIRMRGYLPALKHVVVHSTNSVAAAYMTHLLEEAGVPVKREPFNGKTYSSSALTRTVLIDFPHGLGDVVQFTAVLRHLRKLRPGWNVDVKCGKGKHTALTGLCRQTFHEHSEPGPNRADYDRVYRLGWYENYNGYPDRPNSKITNCLADELRLHYDPAEGHYSIAVRDVIMDRAADYLISLGLARRLDGRFDVLVLHYEGNTSPQKKNLSHEDAAALCLTARREGLTPIILDWDRRSPLPDGVKIHCPGSGHSLWQGEACGDAETIAALISQARVFVGIDSGPGKVASSTTTPTLIAWTKHHPIQFHDPHAGTLHLVPADHRLVSPAHLPEVGDYFERHYRFAPYPPGGLALTAARQISAVLKDASMFNTPFDGKLRARGYTPDYYDEHKQAGLDYLAFGDWQKRYAAWLSAGMGWQGKRVLDVGCACGSILRGLGEAGVIVQGVDLCEHMIELGRTRWPDMAKLLHVADAVNLHLFAAESWEGIHCAQVAEHWRPELVPFILRELHRVCSKGALFFCCLDTEEQYARQGRTIETEDPTHLCVKPLAWWDDQLRAAGWADVTASFARELTDHPDSFLRQHDWDYFIAQRQ